MPSLKKRVTGILKQWSTGSATEQFQSISAPCSSRRDEIPVSTSDSEADDSAEQNSFIRLYLKG